MRLKLTTQLLGQPVFICLNPRQAIAFIQYSFVLYRRHFNGGKGQFNPTHLLSGLVHLHWIGFLESIKLMEEIIKAEFVCGLLIPKFSSWSPR